MTHGTQPRATCGSGVRKDLGTLIPLGLCPPMTLVTFVPKEREKHSAISGAMPPTFRQIARFAQRARSVSLCPGFLPWRDFRH